MPKLVAEGIAKQLERRIPFRRVMKKTMQATMDAGAAGIKVQISGRIGGAEIARTEWYKEGGFHCIRCAQKSIMRMDELKRHMAPSASKCGSIKAKNNLTEQ